MTFPSPTIFGRKWWTWFFLFSFLIKIDWFCIVMILLVHYLRDLGASGSINAIRQNVLDQRHSKTLILCNNVLFKTSVLHFNIFKCCIYSCDANLNFQHHYFCLGSHVILQRYADLMLKKHLLLLPIFNRVVYYCGKRGTFFQDYLKNRKF